MDLIYFGLSPRARLGTHVALSFYPVLIPFLLLFTLSGLDRSTSLSPLLLPEAVCDTVTVSVIPVMLMSSMDAGVRQSSGCRAFDRKLVSPHSYAVEVIFPALEEPFLRAVAFIIN